MNDYEFIPCFEQHNVNTFANSIKTKYGQYGTNG